MTAASKVVEMKSSSEKGRYLQVGELKHMKCYDNLIIICHQSYSNSQSNATLIGHWTYELVYMYVWTKAFFGPDVPLHVTRV